MHELFNVAWAPYSLRGIVAQLVMAWKPLQEPPAEKPQQEESDGPAKRTRGQAAAEAEPHADGKSDASVLLSAFAINRKMRCDNAASNCYSPVVY